LFIYGATYGSLEGPAGEPALADFASVDTIHGWT
jgi:hypothetical protein